MIGGTQYSRPTCSMPSSLNGPGSCLVVDDVWCCNWSTSLNEGYIFNDVDNTRI
jgi:hypothetical protein